MSEHQQHEQEPVPWGQRLYERPFVLLVLGVVIMFVFYTGWGLIEVLTMPQGTLP